MTSFFDHDSLTVLEQLIQLTREVGHDCLFSGGAGRGRPAAGADDLLEPDGTGILIFPDDEQRIQSDEGDEQQGDENDTAFFHYSSPPSVVTRDSRGSKVCRSDPSPELI